MINGTETSSHFGRYSQLYALELLKQAIASLPVSRTASYTELFCN